MQTSVAALLAAALAASAAGPGVDVGATAGSPTVAAPAASAAGPASADGPEGARAGPRPATVSMGAAHVTSLPASAPVLASASPGGERLASGELVELVPRDAVLGAVPDDLGDAVLGAMPDGLGETLLGALPPPPSTVVRETHYFGTVTIDHRAHLARRIACKRCHGPGPVTKIEFTPKIAHQRCLGCHQEVAKGPEKCQGCHVKPPPAAPQLASATGGEEVAKAAKPAGPDPANVAAALEAFERPPHLEPREPFQRFVEVGLAVGEGQGFSVRLSSHQDFLLLSQSVEEMRSGWNGRTLVLTGVGMTRALNPGTMLEVSAIGGFDVFDRPVVAMFPALGLRTGFEWRQPIPFLQRVTFSLSGVADLGRRAFGRDLGGVTIYGTVTTGFRVP